jgi:hypothetical protein
VKRTVRFIYEGQWLEALLAACVLLSVGWATGHLLYYGYLPYPFFYEPGDTWMDWFNTAHWAHNRGAYDSWGTIYPPISFLILWPLTNGACYISAEGDYGARACDVYGAVTLHGIFFINLVLIYLTFRKIEPKTAVARSVALGLGAPMLFGLERGNLVLLCFSCMLLAFGPLVRSVRVRWLCLAIAINLKVYLVGVLFAQLLRRRWRWFEGAAITTILAYLVSFGVIGSGSIEEIYKNISAYSAGYQAAGLLDLWYATSTKAMISLLGGEAFPIASVVSSQAIDTASWILPLLVHGVQGLILIAAFAIWLRPEVVPNYRVVFLATAIALITTETGGYTQILLILFVFMEPWRGLARKCAIVICYLLCIIGDIPVTPVPPVTRDSFLVGREVIAQFNVGVMPFLRPLMVLSLPAILSLLTIREVWLDVKLHGHKGHWRFATPAVRLSTLNRQRPKLAEAKE